MDKETKQKSITLGEIKKLKIPVSRKMLLDKLERGETSKMWDGKIFLEGKVIAKAIENLLK